MSSGESWIRQVLYGKGFYRHALNVDVTTGWGIDTFGHHAQMPQLLSLAGYKSYGSSVEFPGIKRRLNFPGRVSMERGFQPFG